MEKPGFKLSLIWSKATSFVAFLPLTLEALPINTKFTLGCGKAWSLQLFSLAEMESMKYFSQLVVGIKNKK